MNFDVPLLLDNAAAWRTYLGGSLLAKLHGRTGEDGHFPEEWILSLVSARNAGREAFLDEGMSHLAQSPEATLKSVIESNPAAMLGAAHAARYGASTGVLVKLIDAAERLTIQVHPDRSKARELFGSDYGKTECWHILDGRTINGETPCIYVGFRPGVTRAQWKALFDAQDIAGMLGCLHRFDVQTGDTVLIEGGVPHAIGAGCFLTEIQEPTDYTIRTERVTPSGFPVADSMCHQGLGFDKMFDCFHYEGLTAEQTRKRWFITPRTQVQSGGTVRTLVGYDTTPLFAMEAAEVTASVTLPAREAFSGLYVLAGAGSLAAHGKVCPLAAGQQYFVPPAAGALT
ncbi:MAG: type I phosphomannose isomerase catalytic subunit, partial [Ruthenibacterium sp.]